MVFAVILVATAFFWSRIPTIVSGRFQCESLDTRRNRNTSRAASLVAPQIEQSAMVAAASSL
jgi:hypothetical protein